MDTFTAVEQRHSVKHYDPAHRMTDEEIRKLIALAILSPTSMKQLVNSSTCRPTL